MNKLSKIFLLCTASVILSCQSDTSNDQTSEIDEIQEAKEEKVHDINKWHNGPVWFETISGKSLHDEGAFQGALANCNTYGHYQGDGQLLAVYDTEQSYHGEIDVQNVDVNNQLNICGSLNVNEALIINDGIFNMGGDLVVKGDLVVNHDGHIVLEGNAVIEGDLILRKNAILKFLGDKNTIEVLGKTKISNKAIIEGTFNDVAQKLN